MDDSTKNKVQKWMENEEVMNRIKDFITMGGKAFFEEVRSHLSERDLQEYLLYNPDERCYLEKPEKERPVK